MYNNNLTVKGAILKRRILESMVLGESGTPYPGFESQFKGCLMLGLDCGNVISSIQSKIKKSDLVEDLSDHHHCTLLYGIHHDFYSVPEVRNMASILQLPKRISLGGLSLFENTDADVIKFDVYEGADQIISSNTFLRSTLLHLPPRSYYHPHVTVAYVQPGKGFEILEKIGLQEIQQVTPNALTYSVSSKFPIPLLTLQ